MIESVRIAAFCSGSASSLRFLREKDPNCGVRYRFVGVFSDVPGCSGIAYARRADIPTTTLDFKEWCTRHEIRRTDLEGRKAFFDEVLRLLMPWEPEAIMLSGFMLILTEPLLSAFEGCTVNVHPALLRLLDAVGRRKYTGLNVVARTMAAGDLLGSTVHIVTKEPDTGPLVAESESYPYRPDDKPDDVQEAMKEKCDGPAYQRAFERLIPAGWPRVPW